MTTAAKRRAAARQRDEALGLATEAARTYAALLRVLGTALDQGQRVPCVETPEPFTCSSAAARQAAAQACQGCPALELCGRYAAEAGELFGVWGGVDR